MGNDFNEFIDKMTNKLNEEYSNLNQKQLICDILNIYNGIFDAYSHYLTYVTRDNRRIELANNLFTFENFKASITLEPKHVIITENLYNFIRELSYYAKEDK